MVVGMALGCLAFLVAGFVQLRVQAVQASLGETQSKMVVYNTVPDSSLQYQIHKDSDQSFSPFNGSLAFQEVSPSRELESW